MADSSASPSVKQTLQGYHQLVSADLDRTVRFWLDHSVDDQCGGFFSCLEADGTVYDCTKYSWPMCRQVWMLARLYQEVDRFHQPHVLEAASKGGEFILQHVQEASSCRCYLSLTREGRPLKLQRTIFSEAFFVMAVSELYRVTRHARYKERADATMAKIIHWVRVDSTELGFSVAPPTHVSSLSVPMILLMLIGQMETVEPARTAEFSALGDWCVQQISRHVVDRGANRGGLAVMENVGQDGGLLPGCSGRLMNPGHAIEAGWFLLERAAKTDSESLAALALDIVSSSFRRGWDSRHGGLLSFIDLEDRPPTQLEWDMKMWWPHNEAMIAFLMAYKHTKDDGYLDKFGQVLDYSVKHFVDPEHGEWFGYLSREGVVKINAKGGQWKGFFHVPRALMMCEAMLQELLQTC
ncbi:hypothetical protein EGW08_021082 [Elysia chlorotica]|uniref:N-acylglucosamine 2-epimerase n=1 Tax=Elysia chlorotica TaxID=188477 RepID=A0A433SPK4_ELYCH|nr:hypothetical protein EGW08_021082 [Elysia chlorotica]